jgi:hypothetical protein
MHGQYDVKLNIFGGRKFFFGGGGGQVNDFGDNAVPRSERIRMVIAAL